MQRTEDRTGTPHIELHLVHLTAGLKANASSIKGNAFAHEAIRTRLCGSALILNDDELRGLIGAVTHRQ